MLYLQFWERSSVFLCFVGEKTFQDKDCLLLLLTCFLYLFSILIADTVASNAILFMEGQAVCSSGNFTPSHRRLPSMASTCSEAADEEICGMSTALTNGIHIYDCLIIRLSEVCYLHEVCHSCTNLVHCIVPEVCYLHT